MFKTLYDNIYSRLSAADIEADERDAAVRLATAVLMVDVAVVDDRFDENEFEQMLSLIRRHFGLGPQDAAELINAANAEADEMVSVHEFTKLLHEHLSHDQKARVVQLLWTIAYADGQLDKYENSLALKIGDLLSVSRELVMQLKHDAQTAAAPSGK